MAPLGGKRAASFRLVSRRLGRAVAPVWSSILFPTLKIDCEELLTHLVKNEKGTRSWISSIHHTLSAARSAIPVAVFGLLPSLERLHVEGAGRELPEAFYSGLIDLNALERLSFSNVNLVKRAFHLHKLGLKELDLWHCENTLNLFWRTGEGFVNLNLRKLTLHTSSELTPPIFASATHCVVFALELHQTSVQHLSFDICWSETSTCEYSDELIQDSVDTWLSVDGILR